MIRNTPNLVTLLRITLIPVIAILYLLEIEGVWVAGVFLLAGATDWLDGFLARRLNQTSPLGEFLDPVADKLMIAVVLVLIVSDQEVLAMVISPVLFSVVVAIIISREITISALREWMARVGHRRSVAVNRLGKFKTIAQMVAVSLVLYHNNLWDIPIFRVGEFLLYVAGALTLWSMLNYLRVAWPALGGRHEE